MNYNYYLMNNNQDRFFFVPFLTGALVGGAAVGLTRPRPVYSYPQNNTFNPNYPYSNYSYSYYYPVNGYRPY